MKPEERVQLFIESKRLKVNASGEFTGALRPFISVPIEQKNQSKKGRGIFPDIPAKVDADGDPLVRLFAASREKRLAALGWVPYKPAKLPKGLKEEKPVKKGPFGRPLKEKIEDHVDSDEQGNGEGL